MKPIIGIISQARMTSTRLPGKVLMEVEKKSLLKYHLDRLKLSNLPLFIATTINTTDDLLEDFAVKEKINIYRGSENNVLSRYYECAQLNNLEIIIRVTSDCPLIDGILIKEAVSEYIKMGDYNLYYSNCIERTFPRGFDFEIFSFAMLEEAYKHATSTHDLEHVTPYINQNKSGKIKFKHIRNEVDRSDIRITVDTSDDFILIKKLIEEHHADGLSCKEIISLFDHNPELKKINAHVEQKKI